MKQRTYIDQIDELIRFKGCWNIYNKEWEFNTLHLDQKEKNILASIFLSQSKDICNEATSADNPDFEGKMLPTLLSALLKESFSSDLLFLHQWKESITDYVMNHLQSTIQDRLEIYNQNLKEAFDE